MKRRSRSPMPRNSKRCKVETWVELEEVFPSFETQMYFTYKELRHGFTTEIRNLMRAEDFNVSHDIFEKWFIRASLNYPSNIPLIPNVQMFVDPHLTSDLKALGISDDDACLGLSIRISMECSKLYAKFKRTVSRKKSSRTPSIKKEKDDVYFKLGSFKSSIKSSHYDKLKKLFKAQNYDENDDYFDEKEFQKHVFCVIARYSALCGSGMQASIPHTVFEALKENLGIEMECFASPLNCYWSRFCSVWDDIDSAFGSVGSFFNFKPKEGAFEANPPFEPILIKKMANHINILFQEATGPMLFCIIIPKWENDEGWKILDDSSHCVKKLIIEKGEHVYLGGSHYKSNESHRKASFDTTIFVLSNEKGIEKWKPNEEKYLNIKNAFTLIQEKCCEENEAQSKSIETPTN